MTGLIFSIEEFAINDGPGIRTTVFLKGCPLRCAWCHNPEGWKAAPETMEKRGRKEVCGYTIEAEELAKRLRRDADIFCDSGGGVTFTGGEPLQQWQFLCEVMDLLPGIDKAVETSGYSSEEAFNEVLSRADMVLFDIKIVDPSLHKRCTGVDNEPILKNLELLKSSSASFVVRIPLIPGINDSEENMLATLDLVKGAPGLKRVELLRYNTLAGAKYPMLGLTYNPPFDGTRPPKIHDVFSSKGIKTVVL